MIDKLKAFVSKHKQEFDTAEPGQGLWKKIDAKMEVKNTSAISSKWLSKLKYFGLSASILVIAVYFISKNLNNSSSNELAQNRKDSATSNSEEWVKANQNKLEINSAGDKIQNSNSNGGTRENSSKESKKSANLIQQEMELARKDSLNAKSEENMAEFHPLPKEEEKTNTANEKKNVITNRNKRTKIYIPVESEKTNSYSGTIYDNSSLCEVLQAYKFPGKVSLDGSSNYTDRRTLKTISCSHLENAGNMKAVWIKGKTNRKITLSIKEGFKNILLVKSDGREISPEGISHYYKGLGVISSYSGKHFDMIFKDKVDLILFFKDVEEGDKIVINGIIEAIVTKP